MRCAIRHSCRKQLVARDTSKQTERNEERKKREEREIEHKREKEREIAMTRRAGLRPSKSNNETDQTAHSMAKRLSVIYDNSFQFGAKLSPLSSNPRRPSGMNLTIHTFRENVRRFFNVSFGP